VIFLTVLTADRGGLLHMHFSGTTRSIIPRGENLPPEQETLLVV
jgi:hypothetical protein